jgi:hypothetical protein
MNDRKTTPPTRHRPARIAGKALYVLATVALAVVFSFGTAVLVTALCGLTVAAARSGGVS